MENKKQIFKKEDQKLFYIKWHDAYDSNGWFDEDQLNKELNNDFYIIEEVGWIVYEDDKEMCLVSRRGLWGSERAGEYGLIQRIPKGWILERKEINIENKNNKKQIIINGLNREFNGDEILYQEVVELAIGRYMDAIYTVTYSNKESEGSMAYGDEISVIEGTVFNVDLTNNG